MLKTFSSLKPFIPLKKRPYSIDNIAFKLHYRWSFAFLMVSTILVTSRQYFGEHIRCISGAAVPAHVIETFCFFTPTFTLVEHLNNTAMRLHAIPHPGVGPLNFNGHQFYKEDSIKRHAYYQWVPFVLFAQAILFYFPYYTWKKWEGGNIRAFSSGLQNVALSKYIEKPLKINDAQFPTRKETFASVQTVQISFRKHLNVYKFWTTTLILCEFLNLINLLFQIYITNKFLQGQFINLGIQVMKQNWKLEIDILDIVFPKMTKCHFHKYGPSGSLQMHDALCVMALNIINEKIYTFLWFWFMILLPISVMAILWRFIILFAYSNSSFSSMLFAYSNPGKLNRNHVEEIIQKCTFSDWMFLYYLGSNIDGYLFQDILKHLANEFKNERRLLLLRNANNKENFEEIISERQPIDTVDSLPPIDTAPIKEISYEDEKNK